MNEKSKLATKIATASTVIGMTATATRFYSDYKTKWDNKRQHSISLEEGSYVFFPMMNWLLNNVEETRHLRLVSYSDSQYTVHNPGKDLRFTLEGHTIRMDAAEDKPKMESNEFGELDVKRPSVTFTCPNKGGIEALERLLHRLREEKRATGRELMGYNCASYGWNGRILPTRYIDTVFLPHGEKEALMSDIDYFLEHEQEYAKIGAPWHRGYLLYGPPGNGKTSLVQALAHHYDRSVYNLPLSVINSDSQLLERLNQMQGASLLLVEDIDIFKDSVNRENQKHNGPTLAGLLNAFDGINTPNGLITFFTTNNKESLDEALVRPGRMDMHLELKAPNHHQLTSMFSAIYEEELGVTPKKFDSMAAYADILKRNIGNPEGARLEIKREHQR